MGRWEAGRLVKLVAYKNGARGVSALTLTVSSNGTVFLYPALFGATEMDTDDLALDWGNTLFVVGVSLAVVVAVLFVYPHVRARLSGATPTKES